MPTPPRSSESRRRVSPGSLLSIITSDLSNIMGTRRGPISDEDASLLRRQQSQARRRSSTESRSRSPRRSPPTAGNNKIRSRSGRRGKNKNTRRRSPPRKNKTPSPDTDGRRQTRRDNRNRSR